MSLMTLTVTALSIEIDLHLPALRVGPVLDGSRQIASIPVMLHG
jgi:hypothetical protein